MTTVPTGEAAETPDDLFERERPRLVGLAYRMLGTVADAEDVVQEHLVPLAGPPARGGGPTRGLADHGRHPDRPRPPADGPPEAGGLCRSVAARTAGGGRGPGRGRRAGRVPAALISHRGGPTPAGGAGGLPVVRRLRRPLR